MVDDDNLPKMNHFVLIPTLNAASDWSRFSPPLLEAVLPEHVLIIDSSSTDGTPELARAAGFQVHTIPRGEFNHGGTRQLAAEILSDTEILVFLTQDAVLADSDAITVLLESFADPNVAAAFGRQLPRPGATPIEAHARLFNYSPQSSMRTVASREQMGIKSIFISNSFAAYRREALLASGGFPKSVIFGEDTITAARLLLAGWKIAYVAGAEVYHSHKYTWTQDLSAILILAFCTRAKDGCFRNSEYGRRGGRFVRSELRYLWPRYWWLLPSALIRTGAQAGGYRLGKIEKKLSVGWKRKLSMHRQLLGIVQNEPN